MSYESFDGGSHGSHQWVPLAHEKAEYEITPWRTTPSGNVIVGTSGLRYYIVRACSWCDEVWWQEYDPSRAMDAAVPQEPSTVT